MSTTLIATLGGLWALLLWGASDWWIARRSKKTDSFQLNVSIQAPGIVIGGIAVLATSQHLASTKNALIIGAASFFYTVAFVAFVRALSIGSTGVVTPASATYPLFTIIFSAIFVGLSFTHLQIAIMLAIMVGVIMLAKEKRDPKISLARQHTATILAVTAAVLWGVGNVILNSIITEEKWPVFILYIDIWMTLFALIFLWAHRPREIIARTKAAFLDRTGLLSGAVYTTGSLGFYIGSTRAGSVIIPIVVSSASPLITSAMARYFDGDKLVLIKRVGAVVVVGGIILLNLT